MFYELAKAYHNDFDITVIYRNGDINQIKRLQKLVRLIHWDGKQKYECEKLFMNYNIGFIDYCKADEYIEIIHADYVLQNIKPSVHPKINRYVGVSQIVCDSFTQLTGLPCELCYNPISIEKPKKVLRLISATRLTAEKGRHRMIKLAQMLDNFSIPYIWLIFTNDTNAINNPNVVYMKPRLDIRNFIANSDYTVQLSDSEGYCYTILESLLLGVPVITTRVPSFIEMGITEENGFLLDFDLSNLSVKDIYEKKFNFTYTPKKDKWNELLAKGESTYEGEELMKIRTLREYYDTVEQKNLRRDEVYETTKERAEFIVKNGYATFVEELKVEEPKVEVVEEKKIEQVPNKKNKKRK